MQLYVSDTAKGVTLPAQQLVGFARVDLQPGAEETVTFVVPTSLLGYTGLSGEFVIDPGPVEVSVGSSSSDIRSTAKFTIVGKTRLISGDERRFKNAIIDGNSLISFFFQVIYRIWELGLSY